MEEFAVKNFPDLINCKITILGLGYVGLPLAVEFAKNSKCIKTGNTLTRKIVGFDINKERINQLKNCFDKTMELDDKDKKYIKLIDLTTDIQYIYDYSLSISKIYFYL